MRFAESAVLHDGETGQAGQDGGPDVELAESVARRDFLVANQCDDSSRQRDQTDGRVDDSEVGQSEHKVLLQRLPPEMTKVSPVIQDESGDARKSARPAMSCGFP